MNRALTGFCVCATAFGAAFTLPAQEENAGGEAKTEEVVEGHDPALVKAAAAKPAAKHFHALVRLSLTSGEVLVKFPREKDFKQAVEGKFRMVLRSARLAGRRSLSSGRMPS